MPTEALRPLTPEIYNDVVYMTPTLVINGDILTPTTHRCRPAWRRADGHTVTLNRLDDIMDSEIPVFFLPSTVNAGA